MSFTLPDNDEAFNNNQAIWMQTDINALVAGVIGDGVVSGCLVAEDADGASMDLDITSGTIQISDTAYAITGSVSAVTIGVADGSNPRIDLITAKTDDTLNVTAGTAAASPKAPDIPAASVLLAMVYVPASDTTIADNQITDKRVIVRQVTATTQKTIQTHTVLHSETLGAAGSFDVTSIDQTYDHLLLRMKLKGDTAATTTDVVNINFNNDTTDANYIRSTISQLDGSISIAENATPILNVINTADAPANEFSMLNATILDYAGSHNKTITTTGVGLNKVSALNTWNALYMTTWQNTAAINRITIITHNDPTDEFVTGSYLEIIGVKNETVLIA